MTSRTKKLVRLSLAWRDLYDIHPDICKEFGARTSELDISNNYLSDISALRDFIHLKTLVLDGNNVTHHTKIPYLPKLTTLWVNKNKINNLALFIDKLVENIPQLQYLAMLQNEACPNFFNGGSLAQYRDCRLYVINRLRNLAQFNDEPVTEQERSDAEKMYGSTGVTFAPENEETKKRRLAAGATISEPQSDETASVSPSNTVAQEKPTENKAEEELTPGMRASVGARKKKPRVSKERSEAQQERRRERRRRRRRRREDNSDSESDSEARKESRERRRNKKDKNEEKSSETVNEPILPELPPVEDTTTPPPPQPLVPAVPVVKKPKPDFTHPFRHDSESESSDWDSAAEDSDWSSASEDEELGLDLPEF